MPGVDNRIRSIPFIILNFYAYIAQSLLIEESEFKIGNVITSSCQGCYYLV
jgi:hypothetical protein